MYYEVCIRSGPHTGRTWTYDDEDDARAAMANLDAEAELFARCWFGGSWLTTRLDTDR